MLKVSSLILVIVLINMYLLLGCSTGTTPTNPATTSFFPAVAFSDLHFNPFYDTTLFSRLLAASPDQWEGIFKTSKIKTLTTWGNDTNYPLMVLALASIKQNSSTSPVILYTGDLLAHSFPVKFFQLYGSQDVAAMQAFTDKTVAFVTAQIRAAVGNTPVVFALGNIDSYTGYGPDKTFLGSNAQTFYTNFLNSTASRQAFMTTFVSGGYYSVAPLGANLLVIALNTNPFSPLVQGHNDLNVQDAELAWLDSQLASAQAAGQKVWLLMHVPPGADTVTTSGSLDGNGKLTTPTMMWIQSYQATFLQTLAKYPGVITMTLGAHTHMDEFRIMSSTDVLDEVPAITPCFGENPAFKMFTFTHDTFSPIDYRSLNYNLATLPAQFNSYYTFSTAYGMSGSLQSSLLQLYAEIVASSSKQTLYRSLYNSGNGSMNPQTQANWNPITAANWPVFACGIQNMTQADLIACVNAY